MPRRRFTAIATLLFSTTGCSSPADAPIDVPLTLVVTVSDSSGLPLAGGYVTPTIWPAPVIAPATPDLLQRTDSMGRFVVPLGVFSGNRLDSLYLFLVPRGCEGPATELTLANDDLGSANGDTIRVTLVAPAGKPAARTELGSYCAFSASGDPYFSPDFALYLRVDSVVGPRLVGRWRLNYSWTQGDDFGSFTGTATSEILGLVLTHDTPWGACTGMRLAATIAPDGTWGSLLPTEPQGCAPNTLRFDMAELRGGVPWPWSRSN